MANRPTRKRLEKQPVTYTKSLAPTIARVEMASVKLPTVSTSRVQKQSDRWVKYGEKNTFPQYLIDAEGMCPPHGAFLGLRRNLLAGEGLSYSENIKAALEAINDEYTADELLEKVSGDIAVLEMFACQVVYNKAKNKIVNVYHVPSANVRPHRDLDERGNPIGYWVSADWTNVSACPPKFYERFDPNAIEKESAPIGSQLHVAYKTALDQPYFPKVSYQSALNYVELGREMGVYALSSVINSFSASGILSIHAPNASDDHKQDTARKINAIHTGSENAAKVVLNIGDAPNTTFTPTSVADPTPLIEAYHRLVIEQVSSAHRGNPILAGIQSEGASLGGDANTFSTSLDVYNNTVITPLQQPFLRFLKRVLQFNGYADFDLSIAKLGLVNAAMSDDLRMQLLKPEVVANEYGYKPEDLKALALPVALVSAAPVA
jgi:hypothetical protein